MTPRTLAISLPRLKEAKNQIKDFHDFYRPKMYFSYSFARNCRKINRNVFNKKIPFSLSYRWGDILR